jgi:ribosomal protein S18 acetylase RimI-like enzyme
MNPHIRIIEYTPAHQPIFERLNRHWIEQYFRMEPTDEAVLTRPDEHIMALGGAILMAEKEGEPVGTVALKKVDEHTFEMTKMAVDPAHRGLRLGGALVLASLNKAREMGAKKVILYSSTVLENAIRLYRKLGFLELPVEPGVYERADIKMEFSLSSVPDRAERESLIASYGTAPERLKKALSAIPREAWAWKPAPHRWSIHEILLHLADSEANSYIRCRKFIAEPGSTITAYDQEAWARLLHYPSQSTEDALQVYSLLRHVSWQLIKALPEEIWSHTIHHPENGEMRFTDWLRIYENHTHIGQIQRNYAQWLKADHG